MPFHTERVYADIEHMLKACAFTPSESTSVDGRRLAQNQTVLDFERVKYSASKVSIAY